MSKAHTACYQNYSWVSGVSGKPGNQIPVSKNNHTAEVPLCKNPTSGGRDTSCTLSSLRGGDKNNFPTVIKYFILNRLESAANEPCVEAEHDQAAVQVQEMDKITYTFIYG